MKDEGGGEKRETGMSRGKPRPTPAQLFALDAPVLYDGATGTMLQEFGLPIGTAPEKWALDNPATVFAVAQAYVNAGAQIILTCTFGGTAFRLVEAGLDAQAYTLNRRAAELAREAAGNRALVAGSMGPLGRLALALGQVTFEEAVEQFAAQASALAAGGADALQIESMSDLDEVRAAVQGARQVTDLPIFVTLSFDTGGRTLVGLPPTLAAQELVKLGVAAFGANCGSGPEELPAILREMQSVAPEATLIAKPNAGIPSIVAGKAVYSIREDAFVRCAHRWVQAGAKVVGGCCGTTPAYIAALAKSIGWGSSVVA